MRSLLLSLFLLTACDPTPVPTPPCTTECGMRGWGVRCSDFARAEAAAAYAFLPIFSHAEVCEALSHVTVTTRESPWQNPETGNWVDGVFYPGGEVEIGLEPLAYSALGHELFHAVDHFAPSGQNNPGDGHLGWASRGVYDAISKWSVLMAFPTTRP